MFTHYANSPLGLLEIGGDAEGIYCVKFSDAKHKPAPGRQASEGPMPPAVAACAEQLDAYFAGQRLTFDLHLKPQGTEFQRKIWELLLEIPYNETISYLELSKRFGDTKAIRAVGSANGHNPIAIIIPCHRVIGSDGTLVGYGGDLWRKAWLLKHELEYGPVPQGKLF